MGESQSRAGQINAVIDPKLLFLAKLAARYKGQTLIEFLEESLRAALSREAMMSDEPAVGHQIVASKKQPPLWLESLWDEDEVARLYRVATADGGLKLLAPKQRDLFLYVSNELIKQQKKVTLKNFVDSFDASKDGE